ncbi:hypothetical protein [Leucobacter sp. GX24907]
MSENNLFVPAEQKSSGAGAIAGFVISLLLVFGGFWVMSIAFSTPGLEVELFMGGLLMDVVGFWLAFGLIPSATVKKH